MERVKTKTSNTEDTEKGVLYMNHKNEIESLKEQIVSRYKPNKIYLFGSCAVGLINKNSDIDLCIITDFEDKRMLTAQMQMELESSIPFDIVLYTPKQWGKYQTQPSSFAHLIANKGVVLYG